MRATAGHRGRAVGSGGSLGSAGSLGQGGVTEGSAGVSEGAPPLHSLRRRGVGRAGGGGGGAGTRRRRRGGVGLGRGMAGPAGAPGGRGRRSGRARASRYRAGTTPGPSRDPPTADAATHVTHTVTHTVTPGPTAAAASRIQTSRRVADVTSAARPPDGRPRCRSALLAALSRWCLGGPRAGGAAGRGNSQLISINLHRGPPRGYGPRRSGSQFPPRVVPVTDHMTPVDPSIIPVTPSVIPVDPSIIPVAPSVFPV